MMRHRREPTPEAYGSSSSSDDDDVFSALSRKRKVGSKVSTASGPAVKKNNHPPDETSITTREESNNKPERKLPVSVTSSNKRHHGVASDSRKAKMDALLLELEAEKHKAATEPQQRRGNNVPDKKGSFCEPGEEHLTTNIFVGNLAPSITEEQMADLFRQFGDLYSVKIMWPRTAEERSRNRHTGFVCFMNRQDAEDAMDACDEADPFNVGRRLMMRWGKNVKKIVKKGTGGIPIAPIQKKTRLESGKASPISGSNVMVDGQKTIRVVAPQDKRRAHFISTVASYVAKDGSQSERVLVQRESNNPAYDFLTAPSTATETRKQENTFYKWRVYSFCQGDSFNVWRVEPFTMFQPNGCIWVPPPLDADAARREEEEEKRKEEELQSQKQQRKFHSTRRGLATGRQLEQARRGGATLTTEELAEFDVLFKKQLCASRDAICEAMAFCFEKSAAAKQISSLLNDLLLDMRPGGISVETITARLFLISDILFNSQQPGVRNAFMYRDAIERRSPDWFKSIGSFARENLGRMSFERLASSISAILAAWTNWHVYDPVYMDELQARFEGREFEEQPKVEQSAQLDKSESDDTPRDEMADAPKEPVIGKPRGGWTSLPVDSSDLLADQSQNNPANASDFDPGSFSFHKGGGPTESAVIDESNKEGLRGEIDLDSMEDPDGEPLQEDDMKLKQVEGKTVDTGPASDDADGEPLVDEDADGHPLEEDDPDGKPLDYSDPDGEPLAESDADGESLGEEDDVGEL